MNEKRKFPGTAGSRAGPDRQSASGDDAQLDQDFAALQEAWSGLEETDPPQLVDQAVLNAARRAVTHTARRGSRLRWLGGLATAGVVVLTVAIVTQQDGHAPQPAQEFRGLEAPQQQESPIPVDEPRALTLPVAREMSKATPDAELMAPESVAPGVAASAIAERDEPSMADEAVPPAEEWMQRLRRLREDGPPEVFQAELEAFRAAYPDYPLPADWLE